MMQSCVNAALHCLAPSCDCTSLGLDKVVGTNVGGSPKRVLNVL